MQQNTKTTKHLFACLNRILRTPRPATEPRDGPTRNFHEKYQKNTLGQKFWNPKKIPRKYRKNTKNAHFWYFGGIFSVFSGYFRGKFWESRISGRGVFFRYFSWKFRVGPFRGSVAGRGVLKQNPLLLSNFLFFWTCSRSLQKLFFAENTITIVSSAEHSFCGSQVVNSLLETPIQNTLSPQKVIFWFSHVPAETLFL